jgi:hypothetical protein
VPRQVVHEDHREKKRKCWTRIEGEVQEDAAHLVRGGV